LIAATPQDSGDRVGLILNQLNRQHPSTAGQIADSLSVPLLAALPPDPRSVGYQIHFGRPCASDSNSSFGRSIRGLASRLQKSVDAEAETEAAK
jgi:Flp pilus assembly CpaE family ATPase